MPVGYVQTADIGWRMFSLEVLLMGVADVQLRGSPDGVICTMGQGHTKPSDTCPLFLQDIAVHNIKNQK